MKSKLLKLTVAAFVAMTLNVSAQAPLGPAIITETFENWTGSTPTNWVTGPANTITTTSVSSVVQITSTATNTPQSGSFSCKLINTASSYTPGIMAHTATVVAAAPTAYQVSYYARGKGTITCEVTDGSAATSSANYAAGNGQTVSGKAWHHFVQTVIAPTTTNNAQFCLKVKSTGTYTASGGVSIQGIDVDSFVVQPYTPMNASLYNIQYTTATNGNSPFFGQYVNTGGIVTAKVLSSSSTLTSPAYGGYYIQNTGASTWAAGYVFDSNNSPNVGDSITFMCAVDEYYNMTEFEQILNFATVSSGHIIAPTLVTTQTVADESNESMLVSVQNATVNTYSANYGEGTLTDASGVPGYYDFKTNFYAPNGSGGSGYAVAGVSTTGPNSTVPYCVTGNVNYEFSQYYIIARDSADIQKNCTALTGIEKHNGLNAVTYPNPVTNQFNVTLPSSASKINVSFTDVLGKEVMTNNNLSGSQISINDINLPAGVYVVKIIADGKTQVVKVIKQ